MVLCSRCSYPIKTDYVGQAIKCPYCDTRGIVQEVNMLSRVSDGITQNVALPTWLVAGGMGLALGLILGPLLLTSTREGSQYLAELTEKRLKGARKKLAER